MIEIRNKRILVTGGAGFLGSNLSRRLREMGAELHLIARPGTDLWRLHDILSSVKIHRVDLRDGEGVSQIVKLENPDIVFHFAAPGGHPVTAAQRLELLETCALGTFHLLEAVLANGIQKFVYGGSSLEYGTHLYPLKETDPLRPNTIRGVGKAASAALCQCYAHSYQIPLVLLRFFSVYGPWERASRFIPTLLRAGLTNQPVSLTVPGIRHDFIFVEDVVNACVNALHAETLPGEAFNVGSGMQWSNEEVVDIVEFLFGQKLEVRTGDFPLRSPDSVFWVADIEKARRILSWHPLHTLEEGLRKTMEWMTENDRIFQ